jgi:hypothetical protein
MNLANIIDVMFEEHSMKLTPLFLILLGFIMSVRICPAQHLPETSAASSAVVQLDTLFLQEPIQHETCVQSGMRGDQARVARFLFELREAKTHAAFAQSYTDTVLDWLNNPALFMGISGALVFWLAHEYYLHHQPLSGATAHAVVAPVTFALPHAIEAFYSTYGAVQPAFGA